MSLIQLKDVNIFQGKHLVLSDVNFNIDAGEFVYLIGQTGSGKSSVLKTLYGDLPLTQGTGSVGEHNLSTLKDKDIPALRRDLGIVFQDFQLLSDRSVADNLDFVLRATGWKDKDKRSARIIEVLSMVGMQHKKHKSTFEISGGEQQRVSIARALLNEPELIIADEPTGNLDPETSQEIMQLFRKLHSEGISVIMATHDYNMIVKFPGKIYQCDKGNLNEVIPKK